MGKTPDDIEREIAQHRADVTTKVHNLRSRVSDGMESARTNVKEQVTERAKVHEYVEQRPVMSLATAFGAGIALGALSGSISMGGGRESTPSPQQQPRTSAAGGLGELIGTLTGTLSGTLQDELRQSVRTLFNRDDTPSTRTAKQNGAGARAAPDTDPVEPVTAASTPDDGAVIRTEHNPYAHGA